MTSNRIVIRTPNWLGDLMMSTSFINTVLEHFSEFQVDLIVKKGFENLPLPNRGEILSFDKKTESAGQFGKLLRGKNYKKFFVLPPSFSSAWMAFLSGAKERIGLKNSFRSLFLNKAIPYQAKHRSVHLIEEYNLLIDTKLASPSLAIDQHWIESFFPSNKFPAEWNITKSVVLAPGAIFGPSKEWPVEYWKSLASRLAQDGKFVIVCGVDKDFQNGVRILEGLNEMGLNLCGLTSLNELIAILASCESLISNDSGAMHVMACLQKKQIAIFGSTSKTWTSPFNEKAKIIHKELECSPCYQRTCKFGHYNCLKQITPEEVMKTYIQEL